MSPKPRWKLAPWQYQFALWWCEQAEKPSRDEQARAATALANARTAQGELPVVVTYRQLARLKRREDWQRFVEQVTTGGIEAARAQLLADLPMYISLHSWGALEAKARGDIRALPAYTTPALERTWPRRDSAPAATAQVTIQLSPEQLRAIGAPPVEIVAQRIYVDEVEGAPETPALPKPVPDARSRQMETHQSEDEPAPWDAPYPRG